MTHTPGPWKLGTSCDGFLTVTDGSKTICTVGAADLFPQIEIDAALIAAAPQLLAALKSLVLSTDGIVSGPESDLCACCGKDYIDEQIRRAEAGEDCIYECTDPDCPRVQAMQAIAQATGEQVPA